MFPLVMASTMRITLALLICIPPRSAKSDAPLLSGLPKVWLAVVSSNEVL